MKGTYQTFSAGGQTIGSGMYLGLPPMPFWLYYFNIDNIDAASGVRKSRWRPDPRGPLEVHGGGWVVRCTDPQGAMFALAGMRSNKTLDSLRAGIVARSFCRSVCAQRGADNAVV